MDWQAVAARLFPQGHTIRRTGDLLCGTGNCHERSFAVIGTAGHAEVGVELALAMAAAVLEVVRDHPGRALLFLVDTQGQRLRRRDEMLGINAYMAHVAKCVELARQRGHRIIGLIYDQALAGGFIPSALMADYCAALPEAEIRVMSLHAMARVTRIPESRLRKLSASSPVFAPGAANFARMGAIDALWDGDLSSHLLAAALATDTADHRREHGLERGGRVLAQAVSQRVADDA